MGLQIEGGTGNGYSVGVNEQNQLLSLSTTITKEHEINHADGQSYSIPVTVTPTGAGDCFLYLKNNNELDLVVSELMLAADSGETIMLKLNDVGTPVGGVDVIPANRNAGSGKIADATVYSGTDITGMAGGVVVFGVFIKGGESSQRIAPLSGFIIPKNKVLTAYVGTGGILVRFGMGISFNPSH